MALRIKKKKVHLPEMGLNITSLIDVLTVMIFFLIRAMTVTSESVNIPEGVRLPAAVSDIQVEEASVVSISAKELRLNHDIVTQLQNGRFAPSEIAGDGRTLSRLKSVLEKERQKKKKLFVAKGGADFLPPGKILIQADRGLHFETLKYLLHTASVSGYADYQFVVVPRK